MSWSAYSRTQRHFRVWPLRGGPVNAFSHTLTHNQSKYDSQVSHSLSLCDCVKTNSHSLLVHLYARLFEIAGAQLCQIIEIAFFFCFIDAERQDSSPVLQPPIYIQHEYHIWPFYEKIVVVVGEAEFIERKLPRWKMFIRNIYLYMAKIYIGKMGLRWSGPENIYVHLCWCGGGSVIVRKCDWQYFNS